MDEPNELSGLAKLAISGLRDNLLKPMHDSLRDNQVALAEEIQRQIAARQEAIVRELAAALNAVSWEERK